MLQDMFGEDSVPKIFKGEKLYVTVNNKRADIDLSNLVSMSNIKNFFAVCKLINYEIKNKVSWFQEVICPEDETFQQIVQTAVTKLYQSLAPPQVES